MVRKLTFLLIAASTMFIVGCQSEKIEQSEEGRATHKLIVSAYADTETKTSVTAVSGGYQVSWNVGDQILLHECAPEAGEDDYDALRIYWSKELSSDDIVDNKAGFIFEEIEDREASEFSYIATYGDSSNPQYFDWSSDEYLYEKWATSFDYEGERLDPHMVIEMRFPENQTPGPDTFDPYADLMVSDMKVTSEQLAGEVSFRFARLGTIAKMTLTGLNDYIGKSLGEITLSFGESFQIPSMIQYDPVLYKYVSGEGEMMWMLPAIRIEGSNITVKADGTADVWFRVLSGEVTDWFRVDICIEEDNLARFIDLTKLRRTLTFEEGGMTTFSVGDFSIPDVESVGDISWTITDAMDGFIATWDNVDHASGYESFISPWSSDDTMSLTPTDNGNGTWSVSVGRGMAKNNYTLHVKPIPEEDHELIDPEYSTEDIPIGVPSEYWFSHTTFSDDKESIDGTDEYIIPEFSPGKVRFKNLRKTYDSSWTALEATGDWFMYSTEPLKMHSIELWTKDDSRSCFKVYASSTPGAESQELTGTVIETSEIDAGSDSYKYKHTYYKYRFTFPETGDYKYYTIKGTQPNTDPAVVMTSQYIYVYRYKMSSEE